MSQNNNNATQIPSTKGLFKVPSSSSYSANGTISSVNSSNAIENIALITSEASCSGEVDRNKPTLSTIALTDWRGELTTFGGFTGTTPKQEIENAKWSELSDLLAPSKPIVIADKKQGQYVVPCMLKSAEFVGNTRDAAIRNGQSTIGKMRSKSHVTDAKFLMMDLDGVSEAILNNGLSKLEQDGVTYLAYTTHSHGSKEKPGMRVRVAIPLDRAVSLTEYTAAWHGADSRYFTGKAGEADVSGASMYQQQGTWCSHSDRIKQAQVWRNCDGVISVDTLISAESLTIKGITVKSEKSSHNQSISINTINNTDFPASDANQIAEVCNQIRIFRDTKGAGQSEPQWHNCIGVTAFCENGEVTSQEWSSGHVSYDKAETARKLVNRMHAAPTTCSQFKNTSSEFCVGCTQTCKSPITLGRPDQHKSSLTNVGISVNSNASAVLTQKQYGRSEALEVMQKLFALIQIGGKVWVIEGNGLSARDNKGAVKKLELLNRGDGALLIHRALRAQFPNETSKVIEEFMLSPHTICYEGVEFNPAGTTKNHLNLWVGPTVAAKAGGWEFIRDFLLNGICNGHQEHYFYLIQYIAHALQKPWEKPGVMIIMIGGQGVGKGTLGQILRKIWSATYLQVSNIDNVTGNFNASLERAYIVFMDEALFSGDRKGSDALKSLVTEPVIHINEKHQPSRQTDSYLRFFLATNADHVKNTERDDRRDFVLRVSEAHKGDRYYWEALYYEIENGGVEAMVFDLLTMDLSEFNVRYKPSTKELIGQKLQSLGPIERWWHDCLYRGQIWSDSNNNNMSALDDDIEDWPDFISTGTAIDYLMNMTGGKVFRKPSANDMVDAIKKLCPSVVNKQLQVGKSRRRGLSLPPLEQARLEFDAYIGGSVQWVFDEKS